MPPLFPVCVPHTVPCYDIFASRMMSLDITNDPDGWFIIIRVNDPDILALYGC
jgi:hypothetical protein